MVCVGSFSLQDKDKKMHKNEPSLLTHLTEVRKKLSPQDGGISAVIYCGKVHQENKMTEALAVHRKVSSTTLFSGSFHFEGRSLKMKLTMRVVISQESLSDRYLSYLWLTHSLLRTLTGQCSDSCS
jgi:hypothetical protein